MLDVREAATDNSLFFSLYRQASHSLTQLLDLLLALSRVYTLISYIT